jgi:hypothetical protein
MELEKASSSSSDLSEDSEEELTKDEILMEKDISLSPPVSFKTTSEFEDDSSLKDLVD